MPHIQDQLQYRTVGDADVYFSNQLFATDWTGASDADKQIALKMASNAIDRLGYKGVKNSLYAALVADGGEDGQPGDVLLAGTSLTQKEIDTANAEQVRQWPRDNALEPEQWVIDIATTVNSGTYTLTLDNETTAPIAYDANAATIVAALEALSTVSVGDFTVTQETELGFNSSYITHAGTHKNHRLSGTDVDLSGGPAPRFLVYTLNDNVPDDIFYAVCEEARELLAGRDPQQEHRNMELTSEGVGGQQASFAVSGSFLSKQPPQHTVHQIVSPRAWQYLVPYLNRKNDGFNVRSI